MTVEAPPQIVELEVESIAAGGDGVGRREGLVVFTPRTAPGDFARVRIESLKRFARGHLESLIVASPDRVDPPCPHYTSFCGPINRPATIPLIPSRRHIFSTVPVSAAHPKRSRG